MHKFLRPLKSFVKIEKQKKPQKIYATHCEIDTIFLVKQMEKHFLAVCFGIIYISLITSGNSLVNPQVLTFKGESKMNVYQAKQEALLQEVEAAIEATSSITGIYKLSLKVLDAFKKVPRHLFVPAEEEQYAYLNNPLPIGEGQTISQPFIVLMMTELLDVQPTDKVLEIGTGSGYQAAILSQLALEVYTIEIFLSLAEQARRRFKKLGYQNVHTLVDNGAKGWLENAPYDKIIVTAAAEKIPQALIDQLAPSGIMVIPLGKEGGDQLLTVVRKNPKGQITQRNVLPVRFVPFK